MARAIDKRDLRGFSIVTADLFGDGDILLALVDDERLRTDPEDDHAFMARMRENDCRIGDIGWPIRAQLRIDGTEPAILSIGPTGRVRSSSTKSGGRDEVDIGTASGVPLRGRTIITDAREVAGTVYAVGSRRAVYARRGPNKWEAIDNDCYSPEDFRCGFSAIDGLSEEEIYAVGRRGEIWQYDGQRWHQRDSGTNVTLHDVHCMPSDDAVVVGASGTILRGEADRWAQLPGIDPGYEFWSVVSFGKRIYMVANSSLVFNLNEAMELELVDFGDCPIPTTVHLLKVRNGKLYLFGSKDIRVLDETGWSSILALS